MKLRVDVFVVEQNCPYHELDGLDKIAYHLWLEDSDGIAAYLRIRRRERRLGIRRLEGSFRREGAAELAPCC